MRICLFVLVIFGISANVASGQKAKFRAVKCDGFYKGHLQGICTNNEDAIFWSFTVALVKTDGQGKIQKKIPVKNHHGDLCYANGKVYVATNLGRFNDPKGNADNWIYEYNAIELSFVKRYRVAEVFHGAGGIAYRKGRFFVVGGLPKGIQENYVYEYDQRFKFIKKHVIKSGYTLLGIQTATFANGYFWFGCYGKTLLKADTSFKLVGKYDFDCGLGLVGIPGKRFLSASGSRNSTKGYTGAVSVAAGHEKKGLVIRKAAKNSKNSTNPTGLFDSGSNQSSGKRSRIAATLIRK